ncbi:hypothetical protein BKA56DRAFT_171824 [Ilyonectria sp. MPI-CAGE-AT-0026]|nr:hypothetical protein BKA56DRAFT_171824 [Ilyonectria sp. MPI-CAGE-AT-0026]
MVSLSIVLPLLPSYLVSTPPPRPCVSYAKPPLLGGLNKRNKSPGTPLLRPPSATFIRVYRTADWGRQGLDHSASTLTVDQPLICEILVAIPSLIGNASAFGQGPCTLLVSRPLVNCQRRGHAL